MCQSRLLSSGFALSLARRRIGVELRRKTVEVALMLPAGLLLAIFLPLIEEQRWDVRVLLAFLGGC